MILVFLFILSIAIVSNSCTQFKSNGERIFYTATSSSGKPIIPQGFRMMHGSIVCANCHGADGHGGVVRFMMATFEAPNITWGELTSQHKEHEPYTEETVKDAITKGIEPNGEPLEVYMPRWQIADEDLNDLINFLKILK